VCRGRYQKGMEAMELFRKLFLQIKSQLAALTVSQKLVIGLLGVIVVATIFVTVIWSAKPQMVQLIAQPMSSEEIARVEMAIKGKYNYQVSGTQVLVPAEQAYAIRGELASVQALPRNLNNSFTTWIANSSPFKPDAQNAREYNNALQMELTRWLQSFPYLDDATVIIAMGQQATLGRAPIPSSASVNVKTRDGTDLSARQARAIVETVSGAVAGMRRQDVHLVGNGGRAYSLPSDDVPIPADILEFKKSMEDHFVEQLARLFSGFGDVKIAVNVVPDWSTRSREESSPTTAVAKVRSETTSDNSSSEGSGPQGEPGTVPNTALSVGSGATAAGRGAGTNSTNSSVHYDNSIGRSIERVATPPGVEIKDTTASISLPRSYFLALFRNRTTDPALKDPKASIDDAKLEPIIKTELTKAAAQAKKAIGAKSDDQICVDWYDDSVVLNAAAAVAGPAATAGAGWVNLVSQNVSKVVLFTLAAGVLGMMLMMVRRAVPAGAEADMQTGVFFGGGPGRSGKGKRRSGGGPVEQLDAQDDVFGEANAGEAVLTGIELDDETLQSRKMVDEVSAMIRENPENAAALVKRWITKAK
jgi:flagellar M-ring protein FliF